MKIDLHRIIKLAAGIPGVVGWHGIAARLAQVTEKILGVQMYRHSYEAERVSFHSFRSQEREGEATKEGRTQWEEEDTSTRCSIELADIPLGGSFSFKLPRALLEAMGVEARGRGGFRTQPDLPGGGGVLRRINWDQFRQPLHDQSFEYSSVRNREFLALLNPSMFIEMRASGRIDRFPGSEEGNESLAQELFRGFEKELAEFAKQDGVVVWIDNDPLRTGPMPEELNSPREQVEVGRHPNAYRFNWNAGILVFDLERLTGDVERVPWFEERKAF